MPEPSYWLDLFTPETWREIARANYEVSGFRENKRTSVTKVRPGDLFLCYLTGKSRIVGILEVLSESFWDETPIWESDPFPVRFKTRLLCQVGEDRGVHLHEAKDHSENPRAWSSYVRSSPKRLPDKDGKYIVQRLHEIAEQAAGLPIESPIAIEVGEEEVTPSEPPATEEPATRAHARIQHRLLTLGRDLGFDVWVARNDRGTSHRGERFGEMAVDGLPITFDETTRGTIELIDVLWLEQNRIVAAFEIECTTAIYSGLLRMADLLAMQPNIDVPLFIVAPSERRKTVFREIRRPVFASLSSPLATACRYISFDRLEDELDALGGRAKHLRPSFLDELAEKAG